MLAVLDTLHAFDFKIIPIVMKNIISESHDAH